MRRVEAKEILKMLDVLQAFADGKEIEFLDAAGEWQPGQDMLAFTLPASEYRVKAEPKYRPFASADEFKPHRDRWFGHKNANGTRFCTYYDDSVLVVGSTSVSYESLFEYFTFDDGSPCGALVE